MDGEAVVILLVEDDPAHAEIAIRNLESCRLLNKIVHVADGQAALNYLFQQEEYAPPHAPQRPHLVLLDLRLPKVDGLEVLRRIKQEPSLIQIPVVVLTTSSAEIDLARAYDYHANSYLVKPIIFEKFIELMDAFGYYWLAWNQFPR